MRALIGPLAALLLAAAPSHAETPAQAATSPSPVAAPTPAPTPAATVAATVAPTTAPPAPPPIPAMDPVALQAFIDGWVADAMAREHVAGVTVSVVQNGQVVLKQGYGFADLSPRRAVDPDRTLFRIGSISKTFTWILVMRDVEAGRMRLDRPVNLYLPEKMRLTGQARGVLVSNLMDHTAGIEDRALGQLFESDPQRIRPLELYLRQERPRQVRSAGLVSSYSNYGAALAGAASAFVGGRGFEQRVEDEITRPLGMSRTTFREPRPARRGLPDPLSATLAADASEGYGWRTGAFQAQAYEHLGQIAPAGAASSTASDMATYMLMLLGDGRLGETEVFGPRAARAFRTPLRRTPVGINGWAHGFMVFDLPGGYRGYGHGGDTIAFHSAMTVVPKLGLGVFISTNSEGGGAVATKLAPAIVRHFYARPQTFPNPGQADLVAAAQMYNGAYLSTRRAYAGLEKFVDLLISSAAVRVAPDGRLLMGGPGAVEAWAPDGPVTSGRFISQDGNDRVVFRISDGRAVSFRGATNTQTYERAPFYAQPGFIALLAGLTALAAVSTLAALPLRARRELRQNQVQARASIVQSLQAGLWLVAMGAFAVWVGGVSDLPRIMYGWPGPLIVTASACALVAAALTVLTIAALPSVWQGGRRVDSWPLLRKMFFTSTVLIYAAFSIVLAVNGALEPWSH